MKKEVGNFGEDIAARYLREHGYDIIARNWHSFYGELDLVGRQDDQLVFFEVKTRIGTDAGYPEEGIHAAKKRRLYDTALDYLVKNNINSDNFRIDSVAIIIDKESKKETINHYINIFEE